MVKKLFSFSFFYATISWLFVLLLEGGSMKIVKITVLKDADKTIDAIVEYDDYRVDRCYSYDKINGILEEFSKQENKTIQELYDTNNIVDTSYSSEKMKLINDGIDAINNYSNNNKKAVVYNLLNSAMTVAVGLSSNLYINGFYIRNLSVVPIISISALLCDSLYKSSVYNLFDIKKTKAVKVKRAALRMWSAFILSVNLLFLFKEDIPYFLNRSYNNEIISTDLNDLNRENLSSYSFRNMQINKIFNDLENNPYLKEEDIKILMEMKDYCIDNEYLNLNELYHKLMTCRIFDYHTLNYEPSGHYDKNDNKIRIFDNLEKNESMSRRSVILHEGIHMSGRFFNRFLNEGMTSLLEHEYYEYEAYFGTDDYFRERQCVRTLCYLVGSDIMLQAYSEQNQELLDDKLIEIYGSYEKVNSIYECMKQYASEVITSEVLYKVLCDGNLTLEQKEEIPSYLYVDGITTDFNFDNFFNDNESVKVLKY